MGPAWGRLDGCPTTKATAAILLLLPPPYAFPKFFPLPKRRRSSASPEVSPTLLPTPPWFLHFRRQVQDQKLRPGMQQEHCQRLLRVTQMEWCMHLQHSYIMPTPDRILQLDSVDQVGGRFPLLYRHLPMACMRPVPNRRFPVYW